MQLAMTSARSLRSIPRTERPNDCMATRRHSMSRSTSPPSGQLSTNCCAALDMWPPNFRTFCLVNTGCNARLRGRHCSLGSTNRLSPAMFRTSSWMTQRSEDASLRPSTSRMRVGRHHRHDRREQLFRPELNPGDRPTGVADHLLPGVERPHQLHQLPDRQRVLRHQRQGADVERVRSCIDHHNRAERAGRKR